MEERKRKEIEYYDKGTEEWSRDSIREAGTAEGFSPFLLASYKFLKNYLRNKIEGKKILDYGCGSGTHLIWLAKIGREVVGIDLSKKSLELAERKLEKEGIRGKAKTMSMDCEKMEFPDDSFDIVFDGGTFSSLDLEKALPEINRVLKPDGFLIGIETLGHNPFTNLKRKLNKLTGKRTKWAAEHIFRIEDLGRAKKYLNKIEVHFFHLVSWAAFPFSNLPGGKFMLKLFEKLDYFFLFFLPFLNKFSFKIVFIFSNPKK